MRRRRNEIRKPAGYWKQEGNLEREVRTVMKELGIEVMPTHGQFRRHGRGGLLSAITVEGGSEEVGKRFGIEVLHVHSTTLFNMKRRMPITAQYEDIVRAREKFTGSLLKY